MRIYHSTNQRGRDGIEAPGFQTPGPEFRLNPGETWFVDHRDPMVTSWRGHWWVIVDVPKSVDLEPYRDADAPRTFLIPHEVVNDWRPFSFERWTDDEVGR